MLMYVPIAYGFLSEINVFVIHIRKAERHWLCFCLDDPVSLSHADSACHRVHVICDFFHH